MIGKLKTYKEKLLKEPKLFFIIVLILIILIVIALEPGFGRGISFEIEDKCGKFVNLISHSIEDNNACVTRCKAQCSSIDYIYNKVEFKKSAGCNSCVCHCK